MSKQDELLTGKQMIGALNKTPNRVGKVLELQEHYYKELLSVCEAQHAKGEKRFARERPIIEKQMRDKNSIAETEAYFRGRNDGLTILEANVAEAKKQERERIRGLAKPLKALETDSNIVEYYKVPRQALKGETE